MKRIGYLYEKVIDIENCKRAILAASKGKRKRRRVRSILNDIDRYAQELSLMLQNEAFLSQYTPKTIKDKSSNKIREILIPRFYPDQCAHHAIVQIIEKHILKSSVYWSCANIKGRGIRRAQKGAARAADTKYCLKYDIYHFYASIDHGILKAKLRRKFKDERLLRLLDLIIDSCDEGVPLGNYTSPLFAELYLQDLDHVITAFDIFGFVRYADDVIITGTNKRYLHRLFRRIREMVRAVKLMIKDNWQIFRIMNHGNGRKIDFTGQCFGRGFVTVRKKTALSFMRQSRRIQKKQCHGIEIPFRQAAGFLSRSGCLLRCDSFGLRKKYYEPIKIKDLKEVIRYESIRKLNTRNGGTPALCGLA